MRFSADADAPDPIEKFSRVASHKKHGFAVYSCAAQVHADDRLWWGGGWGSLSDWPALILSAHRGQKSGEYRVHSR